MPPAHAKSHRCDRDEHGARPAWTYTRRGTAGTIRTAADVADAKVKLGSSKPPTQYTPALRARSPMPHRHPIRPTPPVPATHLVLC